MFTRSKSYFTTVLLTLSLFLTGCSDSDDDDDVDGIVDATALLVNGIPDSPPLTITFDVDPDEDDLTPESSTLINFQQATSSQLITTSNFSYRVSYENPVSEQTVTLIAETNLTIESSTIHTLLLTGTFDTPAVVSLTKPVGDLDTTEELEAEIEMINLSSVDPVSVSLSEQGSTSVPAATLSPGGSIEPYRLNSELTYDLSLEDVNDTLYAVDQLEFTNRSRRTLVITDDLSTNPASVSVFLVTESGSIITFENILANPALKVVNLVADKTPLNIEISDSFSEAQQLLTSLEFLEASSQIEVDLASVFLDVLVTDASDQAQYSSILSLDGGLSYTLLLAGLARDESISGRLESNDPRPISTLSNVQVIHGVSSRVIDEDGESETIELDVYKLLGGESLSDVSPIASGLDFTESQLVTLPASPTIFVVTEAGTETIVAGPEPLILEPKSNPLLVVSESEGGGLPMKLSLTL